MTATKADRSKMPFTAASEAPVSSSANELPERIRATDAIDTRDTNPTDTSPTDTSPIDTISPSSSACRIAILVLGMHRSGTSALTRVINCLGADLPQNLMPAVEGNNDTGFWESLDAYVLNDDILSSAGSSWDDWRRFNPGWMRSSARQSFQRRAVQLLTQDFSKSSLFVLKDPRICRLVPFWLDALREFDAQPRFVLPVRNPVDVAASLKKRDGFSPAKSQMLWLRSVLDAEYSTRAEKRAFVSYDRLLDDWRATVSDLAQALDFDWPRRSATADVEIDRFLDHGHRHHTHRPASVATHPDSLAWVTETIASLELLQADPYEENALRRLDDVRAQFDRASDALGAVLRAEEMVREELATASSTQIRELEGAAAQRNAYISDLESDAAKRDAQIVELKGVAAQRFSHINDLESDAAKRDTLIRQLQASMAQRDSQITDLEAAAADHKALISELTNAASQREKMICLLDSKAESATQTVNQLLKRLIGMQASAAWWLARPIYAAESRWPRFVRGIAAVPKTVWWALSLRLPARIRIRRQAFELSSALGLFDDVWYATNNPDVILNGESPIFHWLSLGWKEGRDPNPLFDTDWYLAQNPDVTDAGLNPLMHYLAQGAAEGRDPSALFDTDWYLEQNPGVAQAGLNPLAHYLAKGAVEGRDPSALFDTDWYLAQNPDVARVGQNPLAHYLAQGAAEGRDPSALFDTDWYLEQNPDVARAGTNPLAHYLAQGAAEGRDPNALFDTDWYLEQNPDVAQVGTNPLVHYVARGAAEGRDPNALFDTAWYLGQNPDVAQAGINPLTHYLAHGAAEGRDPSPLFDTDWYLGQNPDVAQAGTNPLAHYLTQGAAEGRDPSPLFDTDWYLEQNPDVAQAGTNPLAHYVARGAAEGRDPNALFDTEWYLGQNPHDAQAGTNPLAHYLAHGAAEGRDPSRLFDTDWYLAQNPDVARANENPLAHYLASGAAEGRARNPAQVSELGLVSLQPNETLTQALRSARSLIEAEFDPTFYRSVYWDQADADDPLGHFLTEGWREGRDPNARFSTAFYLAANPDVARTGINPFMHYLSFGKLEGRMVMGSFEKATPAINEDSRKSPRTGVIAMVKNEADIIEAFASHLLALFDVVEIVDHGSKDGTREFLADVAERYPNVQIYDLKVIGYIQALTMNFVAEQSERLRDVDWIFLLDADEFLPFADRASFNIALSKLAPAPIIEMPWINAVPTGYSEYKVALTPETPFWLPKHPSPYKKVAYQPQLLRDKRIWIDQGNHALLPFRGGEPLKASPAGFHVIHIPVRSADQCLLKLRQGVAAYQQLGKSRDEAQGIHWGQLWEAIEGKAPSEAMLNGLVRQYGEETGIEPIVTSALPENGYVQSPLAVAFKQLDQVTLPKIDPSELMLQMKDLNPSAAAVDGPCDAAPPARLEVRGDKEIHGVAGDRGFEFQKLPSAPEIQSAETSDLRFIADFLRPSYWDIDVLTPSAWAGHLPFMFCLASLLRPRRFVELGTHFGASFLAYCQTAERGSIPTHAIAIDGWEGDVHAGHYDTSVFDRFKLLMKKYEGFGSYLRMYFHDAAPRFEEGSIDLLHIDGLHTYEAVREDYSTWLPKMSERGLIIFHDINVHERDFGVWRFWKEVKSAHPTMEFRHSHGLGIAYVGRPRGEPIERLISLVSESEEAADLLQQHFEEVAQKSTELALKRSEFERQEVQFQALGEASEELTKLRQELAATRVERDEFMRLARVQH
jgi:hypothetical protein